MTLDTNALAALDNQLEGSHARTTVTQWQRPATEPSPRRVGGLRRSDVLAVTGAGAASLGLTALLFTLLPLSGALGFVLVAYVFFIAFYAVLVSMDETRSAVRDRVAATIIHSIAFLMLLALVFVVVFTVLRGWEALVNSNFYTQDMAAAGPLDPLDMGGVFHAIVGTLIIIAIALVIVIPLGLACAIFLNEIPGAFTRLVRTITEAMTALPSIVAGLFIYASLILIFGLPKSGFAAALAISVMMLPIMIRSADVVLRLVPGSLKEASYALGAGQWRTVWRVTLPTAKSGLTTSIILGTALGIGETAPVLLTAGFTASLNTNPTSGPMISLPLATWEFVKSPEPSMIARGFGTAAVLMLLVLILFVVARIIGGRGPGNLTRLQQKRRARRSRDDSQRFTKRAAARVASDEEHRAPSRGRPSFDSGDAT
jgi:phosphate transport system permease protein